MNCRIEVAFMDCFCLDFKDKKWCCRMKEVLKQFNVNFSYLVTIFNELKCLWMMTGFEKFVVASHLRKPKISNKVTDLPKPIISQTLFVMNT